MKKSISPCFLMLIVLLFIYSCSSDNQNKEQYYSGNGIDSFIQKESEHILQRSLRNVEADWGCIVLMDVNTGIVKAIANLKYDSLNNTFSSPENYAATNLIYPGQLFSLAPLMAGFEDNLLNLNDSVETGDGTIQYYGKTMKDYKDGGYGTITLQKAFELSSNIGISKAITNKYSDNPSKFVSHFSQFLLTKPLGLKNINEPNPFITSPENKLWSGISLPWLSVGYQCRFTPLQILAFYNAIANNGKLIKPILNEPKNTLLPVVLKDSICSKKTLDKAKELLKGCADNGNMCLRYQVVPYAGNSSVVAISGNEPHNLMLCAAYFPVEKPKYSFIAVLGHRGSLYPNGAFVMFTKMIEFLECGDKFHKNHQEKPTDGSIQDSVAPN